MRLPLVWTFEGSSFKKAKYRGTLSIHWRVKRDGESRCLFECHAVYTGWNAYEPVDMLGWEVLFGRQQRRGNRSFCENL